MLRKLLTLIFIVGSANVLLAQTGSLKGTVTDKVTGETLPTANIVVKDGDEIIAGGSTDLDGDYTIKPIVPGSYLIEITFVGYADYRINNVIISANKITYINAELQEGELLTEVELIEFEKPLINREGTKAVVTSKEIESIPQRDVASIAASGAGVVQDDDGGGINVRGGRSEGTDVYIDGMKVRGQNSLPQGAIEQLEVISGGVPAQFGDATSGIINITTKGPSSYFRGGLEYQTSTLFDAYNNNLLEANFTGPLLSRTDADGNKKTLLGYFLAANLVSIDDPDPSAVQLYKVKDDVLTELENNPLDPSPTGQGFVRNAEFVTFDDLEEISAKQNTSRKEMRLQGKIDFKPSKTANITIGGNWSYRKYDGYVYTYSLFNSKNNPEIIDNTWRVFGRFLQSFDSDPESTSPIKNVFYSVQAEYTQDKTIQQDSENQDNFFDYGYVGKFESHKTGVFQPAQFTYTDQSGNQIAFNGVSQVGFTDTLVTFTPGGINPTTENYTKDYFGTVGTDRSPGLNENLFQIQQNGGLRNGDRPDDVYSLWYNTGRQWNGYNITDNSQFRITARGSADVGDHAIQVGLEYEQRADRFFGVSAVPLWNFARQYTNLHLTQLNTADTTDDMFSAGFDTLYFDRLYDAGAQTVFDKNLRESLGLSVTGTEFIDVDSYDPSTYSLDLFSASELLNDGNNLVAYYGYDYTGNREEGTVSFSDFFETDPTTGLNNRSIGAFRPIYLAGYIQDKFSFDDLDFNVGIRVDRFDANQQVLKDPFSLYETKSAAEIDLAEQKPGYVVPNNIGDDYVVYVKSQTNPEVTGYRDGSTWYDASGTEIADPDGIRGEDGNVTPWLLDGETLGVNSFQDYEPQVTVMPRISFTFPITDEAMFFAHYDVLTQRPKTALRMDPTDYLFIESNQGNVLNNPNLKPERTVDYELGFRQKIGDRSALTISAFYRDFKDMIQVTNVLFAYPVSYTTYGNIDFGTSKGLELTYDMRRTGNVSLGANYTLSFASGSGSSATSGFNLVSTGQPNLRVLQPLNFDQRHTLSTFVDYRYGFGEQYNGPVIAGKRIFENAGARITFNARSGRPYTRQTNVLQSAAFGINQRSTLAGSINGSRLPWTFRIDAKFDKSFRIERKEGKFLDVNVYLQIQNLLDAANVLNVYAFTGNPDDDGYLTSAVAQEAIATKTDPQSFIDLYSIKVNNPGNYSIPRRMNLGVQLNF